MTRKQNLWYRGMAHIVGKPLFNIFVKTRCVGEKNIPKKGPALVVCNHRSWTDPVYTAIEIERPINFLAASFNFFIPVVGWVFKNAGVIPLYPEGGERNEPSLRKCVRLLKKGELVGVYPEGMQNFLDPGGEKIKRFFTGFARIALSTGVNIIPMAIIAKKESMANKYVDKFMKQFMRTQVPAGVDMSIFKIIAYEEEVLIRIGEPISIEEYYHQMHSKDLLATIAGRVRRKVIELYEKGM